MFDFHTHTKASDGNDPAKKVIELAIKERLSMLAITDHNVIHEELPELQEAYKDQIQLVNGCEISTIYRPELGKREEVHVVALDFDNSSLLPIVSQNYFDREQYVKEIVAKLAKCGIIVPSLKELKDLYPQNENIGRERIAEYLVEKGYTADVEEAKYLYLSSKGERRAYVDALDYAHYLSFDEAVRAVMDSGGIPVLAHLFSYHLSERECLQLAERFRILTDAYPSAMEVYYRRYDEETMKKLREIADKMELYYSIGSDYHGKETDDLMQVSEIDEEGRKKLVSNLLKKEKRRDNHE